MPNSLKELAMTRIINALGRKSTVQNAAMLPIIKKDLAMCKKQVNYINLTNGIEELKDNPDIIDNCRFIRIQSTALEQNHLEDVIRDLDNDLLMNLALGNCCVIYDRASRRGKVSRALWYGVPWIIYVLNRCWFENILDTCMVKYNNVAGYFDKEYRSMSRTTKRKIKYYKKFLFDNRKINLSYKSLRTEHDGDNDFYRQIIKDFVLAKTDTKNTPGDV